MSLEATAHRAHGNQIEIIKYVLGTNEAFYSNPKPCPQAFLVYRPRFLTRLLKESIPSGLSLSAKRILDFKDRRVKERKTDPVEIHGRRDVL